MKRFLIAGSLALCAIATSQSHVAAQGYGYAGSFGGSFGFGANFSFYGNCGYAPAYGCAPAYGYAPANGFSYGTPPALFIQGYGWNSRMLPAYAYYMQPQMVSYDDAGSDTGKPIAETAKPTAPKKTNGGQVPATPDADVD